jgi:streptogramin lyase
MNGISFRRGISISVLLIAGCFFLAGCAGVATPRTTTTALQGAALKGAVHGGQNPIIGAHVYLYAANTAGDGSASTSLLSSGTNTTVDSNSQYYVTTDVNGEFSISGDYVCPSAASQVYLYAVGGNSGSGENSAAGLLAALGTCPANGTLSSSLYILMNEVSTIATAYGISGYATDATHVSSSGSTLAKVGIANSFATVANLEDLGTGLALATTPGGNGTVPQSKINTLSDILGACINTASSSSSSCTTLFNNAKNGSVTPTDTATAAINIAHNPTLHVSTLYGLVPGVGAPFQPTLTATPNDFSIAISYTGGGLDYCEGLAVDATGNIWVANNTASSVSKFSTLGVPNAGSPFSGKNNMSGAFGLAIDANGNIWVPSENSVKLVELSSNGTENANSPFTGGGLTAPHWITFDKYGHSWISSGPEYSSVSEFSSTGAAISPTPSGYTTGGINGPDIIAADVSGNVWIANRSGDTMSEFNASTGVANGSSPFTGNGLNSPFGIAIDYSGNLWVTNFDGNSLSEFSSTGASINSFTGGGMSSPAGIAIDGAGNIWVANNGSNRISEFNSSGTAITNSNGLQLASTVSQLVWITVDGSGNVWVSARGSIGLTELVGAASPVVTPLVANLLSPYGAHAVNKP